MRKYGNKGLNDFTEVGFFLVGTFKTTLLYYLKNFEELEWSTLRKVMGGF